MVIENVVISARANGLDAILTYLPNANNELHVCDIAFNDSNVDHHQDIELANFIEKRTFLQF